MANKVIILILLLICAVFISGCIFDKDDEIKYTGSDLIPKTNLPAGFTYMGIHETLIDIGQYSMNSTEGVYKHTNGDDVYIQVIQRDDPLVLIDQYKSRFKDANYSPFEDVSFNGHKATKVTEYSTINGKQIPHYTLIWATDRYMILVGSSIDAAVVTSLATATGS